MEMWTYLIGLPVLVFSYLFVAIKGHKWNPNGFIEKMCDRYKSHLYEKYDFSEKELDELMKMKDQLENS